MQARCPGLTGFVTVRREAGWMPVSVRVCDITAVDAKAHNAAGDAGDPSKQARHSTALHSTAQRVSALAVLLPVRPHPLPPPGPHRCALFGMTLTHKQKSLLSGGHVRQTAGVCQRAHQRCSPNRHALCPVCDSLSPQTSAVDTVFRHDGLCVRVIASVVFGLWLADLLCGCACNHQARNAGQD